MKTHIYLIHKKDLEGVSVPKETIYIDGEAGVITPYHQFSGDHQLAYMLLYRARTGKDYASKYSVSTSKEVHDIITEMFEGYGAEDLGTPCILLDHKSVVNFLDLLIDTCSEKCSYLTTDPDYPTSWDKLLDFAEEYLLDALYCTDPWYADIALVVDFTEEG